MATESKNILNDEILSFLYSSPAFQQLSEDKQQSFLQMFREDQYFKKVITTAMSLQETIIEIEATMPKMMDIDLLLPADAHKKLMKEQIQVEGNVYFVPFENNQKNAAPFIICLQQSDSIAEYKLLCKGMLLPLFNVCVRQKRDLVIIPFAKTAGDPFIFEYGHLEQDLFNQFVQSALTGEAQIVPALQKALSIYEQDKVKIDSELMIVTDNQFTDFNTLLNSDIAQQLALLNVDVSVIAMSEIDFEVQPIPFADKVFYVNE